MFKKIALATALGTTFNFASLLENENVKNILESDTTVAERGFPFSYLRNVETTIESEVNGTDLIFANATYNLIFWIATASVLIYAFTWALAKGMKIVFMLSLLVVVGFSMFIYLNI